MQRLALLVILGLGTGAVLILILLLLRSRSLTQQQSDLRSQQVFLGAVEKVEQLFIFNDGFYPLAEELPAQLGSFFPKYIWPADLTYQPLTADCDNLNLESRCILMAVYRQNADGTLQCYRSDVPEVVVVEDSDKCLF